MSFANRRVIALFLCAVVGVIVHRAWAVPLPEELTRVPLKNVYTSLGDGDLLNVVDPVDKKTRELCCEINQLLKTNHETIFLVRGDTRLEAMKAARDSFSGTRFTNDSSKSRKCWLVVYMGITSLPSCWEFESISLQPNKYCFNYSIRKRLSMTASLNSAWYISSLGEIEAGNYTLEIFNRTSDECIMMRKQRLEPAKRDDEPKE